MVNNLSVTGKEISVSNNFCLGTSDKFPNCIFKLCVILFCQGKGDADVHVIPNDSMPEARVSDGGWSDATVPNRQIPRYLGMW